MSRAPGFPTSVHAQGGLRRAMRPRSRIAIALALLLALVMPAAAQASGSDVVRDCLDDGRLSKHYTAKELRDALDHLPTDADEYSDCRDVIRRAQLAGAGSGGSGSGGGGKSGAGGGSSAGSGGDGGAGTSAAPPPGVTQDPLSTATPQERSSYAKAVAAGAAPVELDGRPIGPATLGGAESSSLSDLPTPLLVVLALLALGALGAGGVAVHNLVLDRRPT